MRSAAARAHCWPVHSLPGSAWWLAARFPEHRDRMSRSLVFGLSGAIGAALQPLLDAGIGPVLAVSRQPVVSTPGIEWRLDTLEAFGAAPADCTRILSLGPLDAFAQWVQRT